MRAIYLINERLACSMGAMMHPELHCVTIPLIVAIGGSIQGPMGVMAFLYLWRNCSIISGALHSST